MKLQFLEVGDVSVLLCVGLIGRLLLSFKPGLVVSLVQM